MVKNKGFLPSGPSEIPVQRNQMKEIIYSLLPACKEPDMDTGVPFKADAIIANPPAYGKISSLSISSIHFLVYILACPFPPYIRHSQTLVYADFFIKLF